MLTFSKDWTNAEDFPTYEANEEQVRADMQLLHNETRDYINAHISDPQEFKAPANGQIDLLLPADNISLFVSHNGYLVDAGGPHLVMSNPAERVIGMSGLAVSRLSIATIEGGRYFGIRFENQTNSDIWFTAICLAGSPASKYVP